MKSEEQTRKMVLVCGVGLVAFGVLLTFHEVRTGIVQQLGSAVGMYAAVEKNEYNTLAQQIQEREAELDARERALAEQATIIERQARENDSKAIAYVTGIGLLLLALILMNFYYDWRRRP